MVYLFSLLIYYESPSATPKSCIAPRSAILSCNSIKFTKRDLLSKGLSLVCISPLFAHRDILLAEMFSLFAATFIVTHCSVIRTPIFGRNISGILLTHYIYT